MQQDTNYNVTALVNTSGTVLQRYIYTPYGVQTVLSSSWATTTDGYNWRTAFQGMRYDTLTGMLHADARDYGPTLERWGEADREQYVNGMNRYAMEGGNAVMRLDSVGMSFEVNGPAEGLFWFAFGGGGDASLGDGPTSQLQASGGFQQYLATVEASDLGEVLKKFNCCNPPPYYKFKSAGYTVEPTGLGLTDWQFNLLGHRVEYNAIVFFYLTGVHKDANGCCVANVHLEWTVFVRKYYTFTARVIITDMDILPLMGRATGFRAK